MWGVWVDGVCMGEYTFVALCGMILPWHVDNKVRDSLVHSGESGENAHLCHIWGLRHLKASWNLKHTGL